MKFTRRVYIRTLNHWFRHTTGVVGTDEHIHALRIYHLILARGRREGKW